MEKLQANVKLFKSNKLSCVNPWVWEHDMQTCSENELTGIGTFPLAATGVFSTFPCFFEGVNDCTHAEDRNRYDFF